MSRRLVYSGLVLVSLVLLVWSQGGPVVSHPASEIQPGAFAAGDYSFSGNVGIGTTSPSGILEIAGDSGAVDEGLKLSGPRPTFRLYETDGSVDENWQIRNDAGVFRIQSNNDGFTSAVETLAIDQNGNVGIGTTSPRRKLDIFDTTSDQLRLTYADNSVYSEFRTDSSGDLNIAVTGTKINFGSENIITTGNVGIGTTNPQQKLDVTGNIVLNGGRKMTLSPTSNSGTPGGAWTGGGGVSMQGDSGGWVFGTHALNSAGQLIGTVSFSGRGDNLENIFMGSSLSNRQLVLDAASGNVGVGASTPGEKLVVDGNINVTAGNDVCITGGGCLSAAAGGGVVAGGLYGFCSETQTPNWPQPGDSYNCAPRAPATCVAASGGDSGQRCSCGGGYTMITVDWYSSGSSIIYKFICYRD